MGHFNTLPPEIIRLMIDHCGFEDSKALRLTCKNIIRIANERVFHTHRTASFQPHLERLVTLSKNPDIAPCIKHLVFVGHVLPQFDTLEEFERLVDLRHYAAWGGVQVPNEILQMPDHNERERLEKRHAYLQHVTEARHEMTKRFASLPRHELSNEQLRLHFEMYRSYRQQQFDWDVGSVFAQALTRLPRLQSVEVEKVDFSMNGSKFPWNKLKRDILLTPDNWMRAYAVEADDESSRPDPLKDPVHMRHVHRLLTGIAQRARSDTCIPLQSLKLFNIGGQPLINRDTALKFGLGSDNKSDLGEIEYEKTHLWDMVQGLTHLTSLELDLSYKVPKDAPTKAERSSQTVQLFEEIHAILLQPRSLQVLKLKCDDEESEWTSTPRPMDADDDTLLRLQVPTFSKLHTLQLNCTLTEESLTTLLLHHAATLTNLDLRDCEMNAGAWASFIPKIPHMLKLKTVELEGLQDSENHSPGLFEEGLEGHSIEHGRSINYYEHGIRRYLLCGGEWPGLDFNAWAERLVGEEGDLDAYVDGLKEEEW